MSKDARIVVRLAQEDRDWVHEQADRLGLDDAAWVRMLIRQQRTGVLVPTMAADVALPALAPGTVVYVDADEQAQIHTPHDVNDIVQQRLREAEQRGATAPRPMAMQPDEETPFPNVRPIGQRPQRVAKDWRYGT